MRAFRGKPNDAFGVLRSSVLIWDTNRQLLPSLFPAASECCTTPLRFHTRTKTVRLEPPSIARAVGWLSHDLLQYGLNRTRLQTGKANQDSNIGQDMSSV